MRSILIPTDFSDNAMNAIRYAIELFKYDKSDFYIMHAYQDEIYQDDTLLTRETLDEITKIKRRRSNEQLDLILNQINAISPNPRHHYNKISSNNTLIDEADKIVDKKNIDIIVMGTRGKTNDRKLTFGSQTLQVLRYVQCPVLAIPENYKHKQPKQVLFPTNYLIPYKRRELKLLSEMLSPFRGIIDVLYVSKSEKLSLRQEDNQAFIKETLSKNPINFKVTNNDNVVDAIHQYLNEHSIDMLVMVNTRHSFLENILYQSSIDILSLELKIPFLAMQNMKRDSL
jgi:nucleotide-binding universal stress UspA family protein